MLNHTFCHLSGIGKKTEQNLWGNGILSWDMWTDPPPVRLANASRLEIPRELEKSLDALQSNPLFFTKNLASSEHWRIFPHYREKTAYLDIETTGLHDDAEITTIALYDGNTIHTYVNGSNLEDFAKDIFNFDVLVTYNGRCFDVPFIERYFGISVHQAQIDLRYVLASLGYNGGLKGCEKNLGIDRGYGLAGVDGYYAVLFWNEYSNYGNNKALDTLLAYNIEDVVNLETLLIKAYNINIERSPFGEQLQIPFNEQPRIPFTPDLPTIDMIRRKYHLG